MVIQMKAIYELVRNIVVYLILVTIIMNLVGKSSYRKYINIFTGMVLILIVAKPVMGIFHLSDTFNYYFQNNLFMVEAKDYSADIKAADDAGQQEILKEYEDIIKKQIATVLARYQLYASSVQIDLNTDETSGEYGMVTKIGIDAAFTMEDPTKESKEVQEIRVDQIMINQQITLQEEPTETEEKVGAYEETKSKIRLELASAFQLMEEQIHITIREE